MNPLAPGKRQLIFPSVLPGNSDRALDRLPMTMNETPGAIGVGLSGTIWPEEHLETFLLWSMSKFIGARPRVLSRFGFARRRGQ